MSPSNQPKNEEREQKRRRSPTSNDGNFMAQILLESIYQQECREQKLARQNASNARARSFSQSKNEGEAEQRQTHSNSAHEKARDLLNAVYEKQFQRQQREAAKWLNMSESEEKRKLKEKRRRSRTRSPAPTGLIMPWKIEFVERHRMSRELPAGEVVVNFKKYCGCEEEEPCECGKIIRETVEGVDWRVLHKLNTRKKSRDDKEEEGKYGRERVRSIEKTPSMERLLEMIRKVSTGENDNEGKKEVEEKEEERGRGRDRKESVTKSPSLETLLNYPFDK